MCLCHRFGLKRVAKLLMLRDERHRSFFLFLAVLRAVVQGYVKNIETTYCGKNCRLLPRHNDAKPTTQSLLCRKPNLMTVVASILMQCSQQFVLTLWKVNNVRLSRRDSGFVNHNSNQKATANTLSEISFRKASFVTFGFCKHQHLYLNNVLF